MPPAAAIPWALAAGVGAAALSLLLLLCAWTDARRQALARADLRTLDAGEDLLAQLEPIVAEGAPLLRAAAIGDASSELVEALGDFRRRADVALRQVAAQPAPGERLRRLDLDPEALIRTAELSITAVARLHVGAAAYGGCEQMHGEARHAGARLSELGAKLAAARIRLAAHRRAREALARRGLEPRTPIFGWRPHPSK